MVAIRQSFFTNTQSLKYDPEDGSLLIFIDNEHKLLSKYCKFKYILLKFENVGTGRPEMTKPPVPLQAVPREILIHNKVYFFYSNQELDGEKFVT